MPEPVNPDDLRAFIKAAAAIFLNMEERLEALERKAGLAPDLPEPLPAFGEKNIDQT